MLASGIVNVDLGAGLIGVAAGDLGLWGDVSNNEVEIRQTLNANEFLITGKNGTLLTVDGGINTMTSYTANGITGDILVDLGDVVNGWANSGGVDQFSFLGQGAAPSSVPSDLVIGNSSGSNTNIISEVLVNGQLVVARGQFGGAFGGYNELQILNSEVTSSTTVDNNGAGGGLSGDSKTVIDTSLLRASVGGPALMVQNAAGMDVLTVNGNSQFGDGAPPPTFDPIVQIVNGSGPTMTVFTGSSKVYGPGTTTIYGDLAITNANNALGTLDVTSFNNVNVFGDVTITNGAGNTETVVVGSVLFSDLLPAGGSPEGPFGAGVVVQNDAGFDVFEATDADLPWGLYIDNDLAAGGASTWGSRTDITNSNINTARGIAGPSGMTVLGDNGADIVTIDPTTIRGKLKLELRNGQNEVTISNETVVDRFKYRGGSGVDKVTIDNARITTKVDVDLGDGADLMTIVNIDPAADLPPATGDILIDGGGNPGDTLATDFGPLMADIVGFEFFVDL